MVREVTNSCLGIPQGKPELDTFDAFLLNMVGDKKRQVLSPQAKADEFWSKPNEG